MPRVKGSTLVKNRQGEAGRWITTRQGRRIFITDRPKSGEQPQHITSGPHLSFAPIKVDAFTGAPQKVKDMIHEAAARLRLNHGGTIFHLQGLMIDATNRPLWQYLDEDKCVRIAEERLKNLKYNLAMMHPLAKTAFQYANTFSFTHEKDIGGSCWMKQGEIAIRPHLLDDIHKYTLKHVLHHEVGHLANQILCDYNQGYQKWKYWCSFEWGETYNTTLGNWNSPYNREHIKRISTQAPITAYSTRNYLEHFAETFRLWTSDEWKHYEAYCKMDPDWAHPQKLNAWKDLMNYLKKY